MTALHSLLEPPNLVIQRASPSRSSRGTSRAKVPNTPPAPTNLPMGWVPEPSRRPPANLESHVAEYADSLSCSLTSKMASYVEPPPLPASESSTPPSLLTRIATSSQSPTPRPLTSRGTAKLLFGPTRNSYGLRVISRTVPPNMVAAQCAGHGSIAGLRTRTSILIYIHDILECNASLVVWRLCSGRGAWGRELRENCFFFSPFPTPPCLRCHCIILLL